MEMMISLSPGSEMKPTSRAPIHKQLMNKLIVTFINGATTGRPLLRLRADLPEHRGEVNDGERPRVIGRVLPPTLVRFDIEPAFVRERRPILATKISSPSTSLSARWKSG